MYGKTVGDFDMNDMNTGRSQISTAPERPVYNGGQIDPRIAKHLNNPLFATVLPPDNGVSKAILPSLDLLCIPSHETANRIRNALRNLENHNLRNISFSATHTRNSMRDTKQPQPFRSTESMMAIQQSGRRQQSCQSRAFVKAQRLSAHK
jgi:hypothetical protein